MTVVGNSKKMSKLDFIILPCASAVQSAANYVLVSIIGGRWH